MRQWPWKALFPTLPENHFYFPFRQSTKPQIPGAGTCAIALEEHGAPIERSRPARSEGISESNQGFTLWETMGHDSFIVSPDEEGGKPPPSCVGAVLKGEKRPARRMTHCHRHLLRQREASSEKNRRQSFPFRLLLCLPGEKKKKTKTRKNTKKTPTELQPNRHPCSHEGCALLPRFSSDGAKALRASPAPISIAHGCTQTTSAATPELDLPGLPPSSTPNQEDKGTALLMSSSTPQSPKTSSVEVVAAPMQSPYPDASPSAADQLLMRKISILITETLKKARGRVMQLPGALSLVPTLGRQ